MKQRAAYWILFFGFCSVSTAWAAEEAPNLEPKRLRDSLYSISSDELDPADSLNRVAGEIDLGFAAPSQTYKSDDHYSPGPFSREKALESS